MLLLDIRFPQELVQERYDNIIVGSKDEYSSLLIDKEEELNF